MATNFQFPIAVHLMTGLGYREGMETTSQQLAMSINTSPSFVRRTLAKLGKAGLVSTTKGSTGCTRLAKKASDITLLDIYEAVDPPKAFSIHGYDTQKKCPVSCHIKGALEKELLRTQKAMEKCLASTTLAKLVNEIKRSE